ncbi:MAG: adenosine kinase [SAR324 cluster bacterium]|nr:adenosine kinase [SAR324 cluster bacterium]
MDNFDVYGFCNPLIDLHSHIPDSFLKKRKLEKNRMHLVSLETQQSLLMALTAEHYSIEFSAGGSGANSMIGVAQLGGRAAFTGKIGEDEHAQIYRENLEDQGVRAAFGTGPGVTGSSLILVTDDGARTMNTHLGISQELHPDDVDEEILKTSRYLYLTGYLWDTETQKASVRHALSLSEKYPVKVALSLSDPFCVNRHHEDFRKLLRSQVDMVFCNQEEAFALMGTQVSNEAFCAITELVETVVFTMGGHGALIFHQGETVYLDPLKIEVIDTTGAGDAFAAGFLYGISQGKTPLQSGRIATVMAGTVIEQMGPRIQGHVQAIVREKLGNVL